jgi:beta-lactamase regulating signal transducer with metallopeptidase domain
VLCILYVNAVGFLLGLIGTQVERLLPATIARRWLWCAILLLSVSLPGYYRFHHNLAIAGASDAAMVVLGAGVDALIARAWLAASAVLGLWMLVNAGWVAHIMRTSRQRRHTITAVDGVPVVITDTLGPATVGVWRARVVLPRWVLALPVAQRQYIVRHEDEHRRSHDSMVLSLASLSLILLPWNAALWWQLRRLSLAIEMDCDRRVVSSLGDALAYGKLLLTVAQASTRGTGPRLQAALVGRTGMLERRLTALLAPAPLRLAQRLLLPVSATALLVLVLAMPHPVLSSHAHADTRTTQPGNR